MLAQNSAESVDSPDLNRAIERPVRDTGDRDLEIDPAMRSRRVVVLDELGEHALEMTLVSDEQPVEAFCARGANEPLCERVARGARKGVLITRAPIEEITSLK